MRITSPARATKWLLGLVVAAALGVLPVSAALADNTVTQTVSCPTSGRSASIANLNLPAVAYSDTDETTTGSMTLSVDDDTCSGLGWNVTVLAGPFTYSGSGEGEDIPAANFALTSAAVPVKVTGQGVTPHGPKAMTQTGALSSALKVINANPKFGRGSYTQALGVSLTVPAQSVAGTYTATLVVSATAGP